jgi:hypothetical protein
VGAEAVSEQWLPTPQEMEAYLARHGWRREAYPEDWPHVWALGDVDVWVSGDPADYEWPMCVRSFCRDVARAEGREPRDVLRELLGGGDVEPEVRDLRRLLFAVIHSAGGEVRVSPRSLMVADGYEIEREESGLCDEIAYRVREVSR